MLIVQEGENGSSGIVEQTWTENLIASVGDLCATVFDWLLYEQFL